MIDFHKTCKGASHIKSEKVCQDYSFSVTKPGLSVALVSDGHGGDRYFRSDVGAKFACEVSLEMIREFVKNSPTNPFHNLPLTQVGVNWESEPIPQEKIDILKRLTTAILYNWREKIKDHAKKTPLTEEEKRKVPTEYHLIFDEEKIDEEKIWKVYGCTLMAYIQTANYWFAFQIGDGKIFSFHSETGPKQPVLWDDACFLNKTTSLCDSNAVDEFRCTFEGDGKFPYAVVLGSDGLDDSFGEDKNLINFYIQVLKLAFSKGKTGIEETLGQDLPVLSRRGSQDDMSVSAIIDEDVKDRALSEMTEWQLNNVQGELKQNEHRVRIFHEERKSLIDVRKENPKAAIDYAYAEKEIRLAHKKRKKLIERYNELARELNPDSPKLFIDDIPWEEVDPDSESTEPINQENDAMTDENPVPETQITQPDNRVCNHRRKGLIGKKKKKLSKKMKRRKKRRQ